MLSGRGFLLTEKNKHLRSTTSQRLNHSMVLHIHLNLAKDMTLYKSLIRYVKNVQFVQSLNWILRIYKYVMVLKESVKTDQFGQSPNWILCIYKYVCVGKMTC